MTLPPIRKWWGDFMGGRLRVGSLHRAAVDDLQTDDGALKEQRDVDAFFGRPVLDHSTWDVPERLAAPGWLRARGTSYLSQLTKADWQGVDYRLQAWSAKFVLRCRKEGLPLYVHCAFRGEREQNRLQGKGNSKVVWPNSAHNRGAAVDIVHGIHHWNMTEQEWAYIAALLQNSDHRGFTS